MAITYQVRRTVKCLPRHRDDPQSPTLSETGDIFHTSTKTLIISYSITAIKYRHRVMLNHHRHGDKLVTVISLVFTVGTAVLIIRKGRHFYVGNTMY